MNAHTKPPGRELVIPEAFEPLWKRGDIIHFALFGGRASSKSHGVAERLAIGAATNYERIVCGRQFQKSVADSVYELLEQKIYKLGLNDGYHKTDSAIIHRSTGSRFSFIGTHHNPESVKSLEGATKFWGEEAQTFSAVSLEMIIPTMLRQPNSQMIWTWNPRYRTDPVDMLFRGSHPPEGSYIKRVSWRDNPYFFLTRLDAERRRFKRANPKRYPHVWGGEYDENPELAIFENWEIAALELSGKEEPLFGMDFGYSNDPYALIKCYYLPKRFEVPVLYIAEEAYGLKIGNKQLAAFMDKVSGSRSFPIRADSSRPETIQYLNSEGFSVFGAIKGPGSVKNGITWLQGVHIVVHPQCTGFAEEMRTFLWKADPNGNALPIPAEGNEHGIDAARYAVEDISRHDPSGDGVDYL